MSYPLTYFVVYSPADITPPPSQGLYFGTSRELYSNSVAEDEPQILRQVFFGDDDFRNSQVVMIFEPINLQGESLYSATDVLQVN